MGSSAASYYKPFVFDFTKLQVQVHIIRWLQYTLTQWHEQPLTCEEIATSSGNGKHMKMRLVQLYYAASAHPILIVCCRMNTPCTAVKMRLVPT